MQLLIPWHARKGAGCAHHLNGQVPPGIGSITFGRWQRGRGLLLSTPILFDRAFQTLASTVRVLIVDDHSLFGDGLRLLLMGAIPHSDIVCCLSGDDALRLAQEAVFDLVLLDWNLGQGLGGEALVVALKTAMPASRVVIVSGESGAAVVRQAIEAGAVGFVPKESSHTLLIDALALTAHGGVYLPLAVLGDFGLGADTPSALSTAPGGKPALRRINDAFPKLTPRHVEVLDLLARGMSNKLIARQLDVSDGTVKQHLNAIFRALGVTSRTEAVYLMAKNNVRFD
jgi:two-component system, NarL family, nitrate/nitrite response regulator NarL